MSSVMVMVLAICPLFIHAVRPSGDLWDLKCLPTLGIVGQTTVVSCSFKGFDDIEIVGVTLRRVTEDKPFLEIWKNGKKTEDPRFSLETKEMGLSLKIFDTHFSDEGKYLYHVETDRGGKTVQISISITAKYQNPNTNTWPEEIPDGGRAANLYCNASDGYPAGFIHWFDRAGTNWTKNSDLTKTTKDINGFKSVALSSKLTFKSIDLSLAPFTCVVLNSKYEQDGESTLLLKTSKHDGVSDPDSLPSNATNIIAGVMVIGSLIVGLLLALLVFRKRNVQRKTNENPETGNMMD
ncbi:uncharacterized protein zgc:174863 [Pseudorasbora parva]|uniref:uncharacterized protein zgc:174863 n=1 Tax=Pseudorasbora parva TaxID=51549 RepID=UPI00351F5FA6